LRRGLARGAAPGRNRPAIEQARLIAKVVPARPALAGEQLEIRLPAPRRPWWSPLGARGGQQALDPLMRLLLLAGTLADARIPTA
jgi:hypothetical protein